MTFFIIRGSNKAWLKRLGYGEKDVDTWLVFVQFNLNSKAKNFSAYSIARCPLQDSGIGSPSSSMFGCIIKNHKILIGSGIGNNHVYEYIISDNKWVQIKHHRDLHAELVGAQQYSRCRSEGCLLMGGTVVILCGGDLKTNVELLTLDNDDRISEDVSQCDNDFRLHRNSLKGGLKDIPNSGCDSSLISNRPNQFSSAQQIVEDEHIKCFSFLLRSFSSCRNRNHCLNNTEDSQIYDGRNICPPNTQLSIGEDSHLMFKESKDVGAASLTTPVLLTAFCSTPLPLAVSGGHSLTKISMCQVMLIGGYSGGKVSDKVFIGTSSVRKLEDANMISEVDVTWLQGESLKRSRQHHITFKLGDSVFVAGGVGKALEPLSSCERFSIRNDTKNKRWFEMDRYKLPFPLVNANVIVSSDETFALVIGGWTASEVEEDYQIHVQRIRAGVPVKKFKRRLSEKILMFTIENGFKELFCPSLLPSCGLKPASTQLLKGRDLLFRNF